VTFENDFQALGIFISFINPPIFADLDLPLSFIL